MSLIAAYWEESTPHERRLFLDEAAGRDAGCVTYEFNVFDVTLDFDRGLATVTDVVGDDKSETEPLEDFLRHAASFADDPAVGDGLTEMQRHPPRYEADADGIVRPLDELPSARARSRGLRGDHSWPG